MKHSLKDQFTTEMKSLFKGYPKFVYSRNSDQMLDGIPVFVYHTIDPDIFEKHLKFLYLNGYKTLSINDFYDKITGKLKYEGKEVLLTIDDARSSVWRFAYPLLNKYNMKATVFVIPGVTENGDKKSKNLEDYWSGKCGLSEVKKNDLYDNDICNWIEIKEMYESGVVDIESHTLFHREVFVSTEIVDFITPEKKYNSYNFMGAAYFNYNDIGKKIKIQNYFGLPIFPASPIVCADSYLEFSPEFIEHCKILFKNSSENDDWKQEIKNLIVEGNGKYFNFHNDGYNMAMNELKIAKEEIQKHLGENAGNHLCLPWTKGNEKTVEICKQINIKSIFWGILEHKTINLQGDNPYYISRIKNDFIARLPGKNRRSLMGIYLEKVKRRVKREKVF